MRAGNEQLGLFANPALAEGAESGTSVTPDSHSALQPRTEKLWVCLHFPLLSLLAVCRSTPHPVAVVEERGQTQVITVNSAAQAAGIHAGMSLNAALALVPELNVHARDKSAEQVLLHELAEWALGFTPVVSCVSEGLLLEVRSSLRLFGGLEKLCRQLRDELERRGQPVRLTYAPTALAAFWMARATSLLPGCDDPAKLPALFAALALQSADWPITVQRKLRQMGVHTLADCLRLPRAGFARRIGRQYLLQLDQATGRHPDIQPGFEVPIQFRARLELASETVETGPITRSCQELLAQLSSFLRRRQQGTQQLQVQLLHYQHAPTVLSITLREPASQVRYLFDLLCLRLDRLRLTRPVTGVRLSARAQPLTTRPDMSLLRDAPGLTDVRQQDYLLERLRTRLGAAQVHFVCQVAEHRPERAWRAVPQPDHAMLLSTPGEPVCRQRPLWLLAQPRRLSVARGMPLWRGAVNFSGGAERIETGWWDGDDIRRDYYVVAAERGAYGWVFRDCRNSAWYLHGIFA